MPPGPRQHRLDVGRGRHADAHHVAGPGHLSRSGTRSGTKRDGRVHRSGVDVVHRYRSVGLADQVLGHGRAHHAQPDVAVTGHPATLASRGTGVKLMGRLLQPLTLPLWNRTLLSWSTV